MTYMLDARKLRMLAELDRLGTIAAVARELRLTAPGVSMQLATLEREVGLQLTVRTGRTVTLTPAGRLLASHGHEIVDRISLAEMEVAALREGAAGLYRVAAFPSAMRTLVAGAWRSLADGRGSGIQLRATELEPQDALAALVAGEVELAVIHSYSNISEGELPGVQASRIAIEPVWLATRAPGGSADLRDYSSVDWIVPGHSLSCFEMIQRACGLAGFTPRTVATATDFASQLALVAAGVGVALVPQLAVATVPDGVHLHDLSEPVYRHISVATRSGAEADAGMRTVRELIAESARHVIQPLVGK
jgi:DNA-binding transcriptional LysR family regulator